MILSSWISGVFSVLSGGDITIGDAVFSGDGVVAATMGDTVMVEVEGGGGGILLLLLLVVVSTGGSRLSEYIYMKIIWIIA